MTSLFSLAKKMASTLHWMLVHPVEAVVFFVTTVYEIFRFPCLWINVIVRTVIFGYVTFWPVIAAREQFTAMCREGRGVDGQIFSTRHNGALLDVLLPPELWQRIKSGGGKNITKKYPVIIIYSGGAWIIGRRLWVRPLLLHFADAGFIAVAADYRQWPFGTMKGMIQDALDSISWVFDQMDRPESFLAHADPDQVVVLGQSAGAHICSLALLELAKVRKEQMTLVAQGVTGSDKSYLRSKMKGVPLTFVGVGGMFDLVSTARDLHKRGLHSKVLEMMCEYEPLQKYCARSRSSVVAAEARERFVTKPSASASNTASTTNATSPVTLLSSPVVSFPLTTSKAKDEDEQIRNYKQPHQEPEHEHQVPFSAGIAEATKSNNSNNNNNNNNKNNHKKRNKNSKVEQNNNDATSSASPRSPDDDLTLSHTLPPLAPSRRSASGEICDKNQHHVAPASSLPPVKTTIHNSSNNNNNNNNNNIILASASYSDAQKKAIDLMEHSSSVNFLPRFNLFVHGDKDISAPIDQAIAMCATYNDAAARHPHELVGGEYRFEKRHPSFGTREPFYIMTPKPQPRSSFDAAVKQVVERKMAAAAASAANDDAVNEVRSPASMPLPSSPSLSSPSPPASASPTPATNFQGLCDCYAGSRAAFLSYINGTHTTLVVDDFFTEKTNAPLVVCVMALVATLNEIADKHAVVSVGVSAPVPPTFSSPHQSLSSPPASSSFSSCVPATAAPPALIAQCSHCSPQMEGAHHDQHRQQQQQQQPSDYLAPASRQHSRQVSGSFLPDHEDQQEHPFDYLCAPQSIAIPADLFTRLFEQHYHDIDRLTLRNPERPFITPFRRWLAQKVSAF